MVYNIIDYNVLKGVIQINKIKYMSIASKDLKTYGFSETKYLNGEICEECSVDIYSYIETNGDGWTKKGNTITGTGNCLINQAGLFISLNDNGDILAVTEPKHNTSGKYGLVRVFKYNNESSEWDILGNELSDFVDEDVRFNVELNSDGHILTVGYKDSTSIIQYRYNDETNEWVQQGNIINSVNEADVEYTTVTMSNTGKTIIKSEYNSSSSISTVYKYNQTTNEWEQKGQKITITTTNENQNIYKTVISMNDNEDILVISLISNTGVYKYDAETNEWVQQGDYIAYEKKHELLRNVSFCEDDVIYGFTHSLDRTVINTLNFVRHSYKSDTNVWETTENVTDLNINDLRHYKCHDLRVLPRFAIVSSEASE